ncbi:MAG: N-acetylmuramoyl-L-alanine amidase [Actinomycetota bacterium]|nr:N-acetylmuramoyl-L-alanine amidase [Actinomycetota bacterium]
MTPAGFAGATAGPSIIREGDRSEQVADVQARLRALGFRIDDVHGYFGPGTEQMVRLFQQQRNINADGIVGRDTWSELVEAGWRLGDRVLYLRISLLRGDDVLALQARLNALGFDAGREDGIFGGRSNSALSGLRADRPSTAAPLREELERTERKGLDGTVVVIDPGHGGNDKGEVNPLGASEADLCWELANRLAARLASSGARVRFTRTETEAPGVTERATRANTLGAEIFVSLHLNSHDVEVAEGASTYYFPRSKGGELLADKVQERLVEMGLRNCRSHARAYRILRETRMPAVVIEPLFISNPADAKMLEDADFRSVLADAITNAIRDYYEVEE